MLKVLSFLNGVISRTCLRRPAFPPPDAGKSLRLRAGSGCVRKGHCQLNHSGRSEARANERSVCCHRGPGRESSRPQHSMMHRSQVVPPHSTQILNDAVHVQETLRVVA